MIRTAYWVGRHNAVPDVNSATTIYFLLDQLSVRYVKVPMGTYTVIIGSGTLLPIF